MIINTNVFSAGGDDANYDENDAVWQEEDNNELDEFGFKAEGEEEEEEETEEESKEGEEEEEEDDDQGFGLEKDI